MTKSKHAEDKKDIDKTWLTRVTSTHFVQQIVKLPSLLFIGDHFRLKVSGYDVVTTNQFPKLMIFLELK